MKTSDYLSIACGLLALADSAGAQSQKTPNTTIQAPPGDGTGTLRSANPYRVAFGGDPGPVDKSPAQPRLLMISLKWEVFSLPLMEAQKFLTTFQTDAERYAEIVKRAESGAAVLEELQVLRTRSGQRAKVEAVTEKLYPTEFAPPHQPADPPRPMVANPAYRPPVAAANEKPDANARSPFVVPPTSQGSDGNALPYPVPTAFETRNVGSTLEVEPTLFEDGRTIDVTVAPEFVSFLGNEPHTPDASVMQPKFQTQKLSTSFTVKSGQAFLIGTQSPPHLSGVEGANKEKVAWLSFMTVETVAVE